MEDFERQIFEEVWECYYRSWLKQRGIVIDDEAAHEAAHGEDGVFINVDFSYVLRPKRDGSGRLMIEMEFIDYKTTVKKEGVEDAGK